jgi:RNA polymerase sigma factor (sigma-70 family)
LGANHGRFEQLFWLIRVVGGFLLGEVMMTDTQQLLADYAKTGSETAFRELVTRYIDLVFSTALRLVDGDVHRAQDTAQMVFIDLARQAPRLSPDTMLGGWLHRDTCFVAAKVMRAERRRQLRERQAAEMNALNDDDAGLGRLGPALDEAINELDEDDRKAILLRFYERFDLRSVGEALGSSENAAQKRVARALEQLQLTLTRKGVVLPVIGLSTVLAGGVVTAAPAGLATAITGSALSGVVAGSSIPFLVKAVTVSKLKFAVISAVAVAAAALPLAVQYQSITRLRAENLTLQHQVNQAAILVEANQRPSKLVREVTKTLAAEELHELLSLRGEVGRLRQENKELTRVRDENRRLLAARPAAAVGGLTGGTPSEPGQTRLYGRTMRVDAGLLESKLASFRSGPASDDSNQDTLHQKAFRRFLEVNGINIVPPAAVFVNPTNGTVLLRASMADLDKVEALIQNLLPPPLEPFDDAGTFQIDAAAAN